MKISYAIQTTNPTYLTALQTQKLAGNLTDIIETYDSLSPTLEVDGLVRPLDSVPQQEGLLSCELLALGDVAVLHPAARLAAQAFVGQQFFVPIEADATVFYVNLKDLAAAHFTINASAHTSVTAAGGTIGNDWTWRRPRPSGPP